MQHWALCETLSRLHQLELQSLLLVCTHSMAPWSVPQREDKSFMAARQRLPRQIPSIYDAAWHASSVFHGLPYPSSAVFASAAWQRALSFTLCEDERSIADEIEGWLKTPETRQRLTAQALHRGDWRALFGAGLQLPASIDIIFLEFDPYRFERHANQSSSGDLNITDLNLITRALARVEKPTVLQISSYSANNNNPHVQTAAAVTGALAPAGFNLQAQVEANGNMISLVYGRALPAPLWPATNTLDVKFNQWLP